LDSFNLSDVTLPSDAVALIDYNRLIHLPINRLIDYLKNSIISLNRLLNFRLVKKNYPKTTQHRTSIILKGFYTGIPVERKPNTQTQSTADFFCAKGRVALTHLKQQQCI
jgi:hypothetical protein